MENAKKDSSIFVYTYSAKQQSEIDAIRKKYLPKEEDKMETLRRLDRSTEEAGRIVALVLGTFGTLFLGIGMCCTMLWSSDVFALGIVVGFLGIILIVSAFPGYKKVVQKKKEKIAPQIIALSEELLIH